MSLTTDKLSSLEQDIHAYVIDHVEDVQMMTIRELARKTFSNTTSIMRYPRKLGYSGFGEFKIRIRGDLRQMNPEDYVVTGQESAITVINKISVMNAKVIEETQKRLALEQLDCIVTRMETVKNIIFIAYDANGAIADYASHALFLLGKKADVYKDLNRQLMSAIQAKPQDTLFIVLTRTGKNDNIIKVLRTLRERGIGAVVLSGNDLSPCKPLAGEYIIAPYVDASVRDMGEMTFYTSVKYIFDVLVEMYYTRHYDECLKVDALYSDAWRR